MELLQKQYEEVLLANRPINKAAKERREQRLRHACTAVYSLSKACSMSQQYSFSEADCVKIEG